jgi:hypothetical protein
MSRKLYTRLFALFSMLVLLALVSVGSHTAKAHASCDPACRSACLQADLRCVRSGGDECVADLLDCLCSCGCSTGC